MSEEFSGMCMWKKIKGKSNYQKTDCSVGTGGAGKQTFKKLEVTSL